MSYLPDTNACIKYLNNAASPVAQKLRTKPPHEVWLCVVVKAELYFGAYRSSRRQANLALLQQFFSQMGSLPFDEAAAEAYGQIRAQLASIGTPIGHCDTMIAAIALANDFTLVTHNTREFGRVAGLKLEDWE